MTEEIMFDGGYSREGVIYIDQDKCDGCHKETTVICMDGSESEYRHGRICKNCIEILFNKEG